MCRLSTACSAKRLKIMPLRIDTGRRCVMAIVNVTPDSFYAGSRAADGMAVAERVRRAVAEGAAIIDIGGCSTRPGSEYVAEEEEYRRVAEGLRAARSVSADVVLSVDTFRAEVAARCIEEFGPLIINDISAGEEEPELMRVAARCGVPYVAMHKRGRPSEMQSLTGYGDVAADVTEYLGERIARLEEAGVRRERIVVDPGFGFAKTADENFRLLAGLHRLKMLGCPIMVGISRKSMIYRTLDVTPDHALNGTTALHWECLRQGASILRAHDVREAVQTIRLYEMFEKNL